MGVNPVFSDYLQICSFGSRLNHQLLTVRRGVVDAPMDYASSGVDIDADARQLARAELLLAGVPNCSLRKGDMYRLPFESSEFDTIILDDVLGDAKNPIKALKEANRLLKPAGHLLILMAIENQSVESLKNKIADWCSAASLRLAPPRVATDINPVWMLATASSGLHSVEAA